MNACLAVYLSQISNKRKIYIHYIYIYIYILLCTLLNGDTFFHYQFKCIK